VPTAAARISTTPDRGAAEAANRARNCQAEVGRRRRWGPARDALWRLLDAHVRPGASVAVVGVGNGDDLPLRRLARRAGRLDLIDIDGDAARAARRRLLSRRSRVTAVVADVTDGDADRAVQAAVAGHAPPPGMAPPRRLAGGLYDVVVADLLYTQLLFPALLDAGLPGDAVEAALAEAGPPVTRRLVQRLHASAPEGIVVHLHDLLGWWPQRGQPFGIDAVLELGARDLPAALALADGGRSPVGADPRPVLEELGADVVDTALWRWPFDDVAEYLVVATVARSPGPARGPGLRSR